MSIKIGFYVSTKLKEAPPIVDDFLGTPELAKARGQSFLSKNYYNKSRFSWRNEHKGKAVISGVGIDVTSDRYGLSAAPMRVVKTDLIYQAGEGLYTEIEAMYAN